MADLTVTLMQTALHWNHPEANRQLLAQKLAGLQQATDLVVLPEMFTTGFSMEAVALAENMAGPTITWLTEQAQKLAAVITGSIIIGEDGRYFNRLIWMRPDGTYEYYDKRHLFRMAGEHEIYTAGTQKLLIELNGWRICPLICYDLRFPVWSRNTQNAYDLLLYVANWPAKRSLAWKTLLAARAIENLAYVVGVNRVGQDGKGILYTGDSVVHAPTGETIWQQTQAEEVYTVKLAKHELTKYREKFPAQHDADAFELK